MNRKMLIPAIALGLFSFTGCNALDAVNRINQVTNVDQQTPDTAPWYDIDEPVVPVVTVPNFATQTAPQAPGAEDDGRFETGPAPQAPCDAPYPACGRP